MTDTTEAGASVTVTEPTAAKPAPQEDGERQEHSTIPNSDNQNGHTGNVDLGIPGVGKNPYYKGLSLADIGVRDPSTLISTPFGKVYFLSYFITTMISSASLSSVFVFACRFPACDIKVNGYTTRGSNSVFFSFLPSFLGESTLEDLGATYFL